MTCKKVYGPSEGQPAETIVEDSTHRFVTDDQITLWNEGVYSRAVFSAMVFRRTSTVPDTPTGGSFDFPIPDGGLWSNTPLPGIDPVWVSTRILSNDGQAPQEAVWSTPRLFVQHGTDGLQGSKGDKGDQGIQGAPGAPGENGAAGVHGDNGTSITWLTGTVNDPNHPVGATDGTAYYNSYYKKSFVYWDGSWYQMTIDGENGSDITWKGEASDPLAAFGPPENNWAYRDSDNGLVYIYDGVNLSWELMLQDGADGATGLSVTIVFNDADPEGPAPAIPTTISGLDNNWYDDSTVNSAWMCQKVDAGDTANWGAAIRIKGTSGVDGPRGSSTFTIDESDPNTIYITATTAAAWASTLTDTEAKNAARDIIGTPPGTGAGFSSDGSLRINDKITISNVSNQLSSTRVFTGTPTNDYTSVVASDFKVVSEIIDGNLIVKGTVAADALVADDISGGSLTGGILTIGYDGIGGTKPPTDANNTANTLASAVTEITSGGLKMTDNGTGDNVEIVPNKLQFTDVSSGDYIQLSSAEIHCVDASNSANNLSWQNGTLTLPNLAIKTINIADQQITFPHSVMTVAGIALPTSFTEVQSISLVTTGAPILIQAYATPTNIYYHFRLRIDSSTVMDEIYTVGAFVYYATPSAGAHTIHLDARYYNASCTLSYRTLSVVEYKK